MRNTNPFRNSQATVWLKLRSRSPEPRYRSIERRDGSQTIKSVPYSASKHQQATPIQHTHQSPSLLMNTISPVLSLPLVTFALPSINNPFYRTLSYSALNGFLPEVALSNDQARSTINEWSPSHPTTHQQLPEYASAKWVNTRSSHPATERNHAPLVAQPQD